MHVAPDVAPYLYRQTNKIIMMPTLNKFTTRPPRAGIFLRYSHLAMSRMDMEHNQARTVGRVGTDG